MAHGALTPIIGLRLLALAAGLRHNAEIGQPGLCFSAYGHKFGINHLGAHPADDASVVDDEHLGLLLAFAEGRLAETPVNTDGDVVADQRPHQFRAVASLPLLGQLLADFDLEPARVCERLVRLHASHERARENARDLVAVEQLDETASLLEALRVERT